MIQIKIKLFMYNTAPADLMTGWRKGNRTWIVIADIVYLLTVIGIASAEILSAYFGIRHQTFDMNPMY